MNRNTVHLGDCLELMKDVADGSVDMILCDLPYGTTACKWDVIIPFEPLWVQYKRIIKKNGAIVLTASQPFTSKLVMSNLEMFRYEWIWNKTKMSGFQNVRKMPMKEHENICVFYYSLPTYNQVNLIRRNIPYKTGRKNKAGNHGNCIDGNTEHLNYFSNYNTSIIKINSEHNPPHETQKPVALFEYLIKTYTNEGDLVLDNCAGSGTTAVACINTNRDYILMEKEQKYFDVINERIAKHVVQPKLEYKQAI